MGIQISDRVENIVGKEGIALEIHEKLQVRPKTVLES